MRNGGFVQTTFMLNRRIGRMPNVLEGKCESLQHHAYHTKPHVKSADEEFRFQPILYFTGSGSRGLTAAAA